MLVYIILSIWALYCAIHLLWVFCFEDEIRLGNDITYSIRHRRSTIRQAAGRVRRNYVNINIWLYRMLHSKPDSDLLRENSEKIRRAAIQNAT